MKRNFNVGQDLEAAHLGYTLLGAGGGTPVVDGADQTGTAITTTGWPASTSGVLLAGDLVTFANITKVYEVRFTVSSDGAGDATIYVSPPIRKSAN